MKIRFKNIYWQILRKPLTNFVVLFSIVTVLISLLGAGYFYFQKSKLVDERFNYLNSIADYRLSQLDNWLKEKYSGLEVIKAVSPSINASNSGASGVNLSVKIKDWLAMIAKYCDCENLVLASYNGKLIYSTKPLSAPITATDGLQIKTAIDSNEVLFSDSDEKTANDKFLRFYVPLRNGSASSSASYLLIFEMDPQKHFGRILSYNFDKSPTMESLLVKTIGDSVVYLNRLRFSDRKKESRYDESNKALKEATSIADRHGFVSAKDYKDDNVIALIQKIPSTAWFLITKINSSKFYAPVNNLAKLIFLTIVSADLLFALILFFIWRKNIVDNFKKMYAAQQERSKIENRFETLVNGVKDIAIFIMDANGQIISWNEGAQRIYGFLPSEIIGKHFSIFFSVDERVKLKHEMELKDVVDNNSVNNEGWRIKKDGSAFWANSVITSLKDEDGTFYGFLNVTRDLTEKRNIENEIKKSRDFYLKLLDDFPNPVWRSNTEGKFNYFNKAWHKFTGRSFEEEKGDGWASGIHPEDMERVVNNYYKAFRNRESFDIEYRMRSSNGEYRWMVDFGMPYNDAENNFAGYIGSCYDINERKKFDDTIQTLMRISEKLYSSLEIDQILDSLVTECIQLTGSEGGFACIKNENDNYYAKKYFSIDHWEYLDLIFPPSLPMIQKFVSTKESLLLNATEFGKNMDRFFAVKYKVKNTLSTPLFGSDGEFIGFFEIHNKKNNRVFTRDDINLLRSVARNASISISKSLNYEKLRQTELQLRNSESELRNLTAQIQYAREAERQHIAREVHDELGQLFTGINLNISLLTELLEQNKHLALDEILDELHSVQELVNKGIQSVRDISGSLRSYVLDHLGLIPAINEYCREIERISNVKCNFNSEIESFDLDDEKNVALFRIVQEALTNVIRHASATELDVNISSSDDNVEIVVSDNGKGIPDGSEFFSHSMGILGMKERAIFLGGKLKIDGKEGAGTKINISVPYQRA